MSHTTKVTVEYLDPDSLEAAVIAMGGTWLGMGDHKLFSSMEQGLGFTMPGWRFPLILQDGGGLAYDDYQGWWGTASDIDKLTAEYSLQVAFKAAQAQGWYCERHGSEVVIHHPDGGIITVDAQGAVDASQFAGPDCVSACAPIEGALGSQSERSLKGEFYQRKQIILNHGE